MRVRIRFPDGTVKVYHVDAKKAESLEDIADMVLDQMVREYSRVRQLKNPEAYREGVKRWLYPAIVTSLLEKFG